MREEIFKMSKEVTNQEILRAVTELINGQGNLERRQVNLAKSQSNLEKKIDQIETDIATVDKKVDLINRKFTIITENQLTQQADIRELQNVNNLICPKRKTHTKNSGMGFIFI